MNFLLKTDKYTRNVLLVTGTVTLLYTFLILVFDSKSWLTLIPLNLSVFLVHFLAYKTSKITIEENDLIVGVFWIRKRISIDSIRAIEFNKSWSYSGSTIKVAMSKNNLIVHYNKFDEILIGPKDERLFIQELEKRNPEIMTKGEPR